MQVGDIEHMFLEICLEYNKIPFKLMVFCGIVDDAFKFILTSRNMKNIQV